MLQQARVLDQRERELPVLAQQRLQAGEVSDAGVAGWRPGGQRTPRRRELRPLPVRLWMHDRRHFRPAGIEDQQATQQVVAGLAEEHPDDHVQTVHQRRTLAPLQRLGHDDGEHQHRDRQKGDVLQKVEKRGVGIAKDQQLHDEQRGGQQHETGGEDDFPAGDPKHRAQSVEDSRPCSTLRRVIAADQRRRIACGHG